MAKMTGMGEKVEASPRSLSGLNNQESVSNTVPLQPKALTGTQSNETAGPVRMTTHISSTLMPLNQKFRSWDHTSSPACGSVGHKGLHTSGRDAPLSALSPLQ